MSDIVNLSRRGFFAAGGGLVLGMHLSFLESEASAEEAEKPKVFAPNAFVRVMPDDRVVVVANHSEMGQGAYTVLAMLVAEELDADWSKVETTPAPIDPAYNHLAFGMQATGGSTTTHSEYDRLRKAGASARYMLVAAAAAEWKVAANTCRTEAGVVIHDVSGKRATYGSLVEKAAKLRAPIFVTLKDPKDFKLIGKGARRLDTPSKTNGTAMFGMDVAVPGMLTALIARPPVFGAKLKSFDDTKAKAVPGVRHVVAIDRGVAVVADGFYAAKLGREALTVVWDEGPLAALDSVAQGKDYADLAKKPGKPARKDGDAEAALTKAAKVFEATYDLPYLSHSPMEPLNCVADVRDDGCEVWVGTQFQTTDWAAAVKITGLPPAKVRLNTMLLGGGFGRRGVMDAHFVREAVLLSKAVKKPVKVIWTREDDIKGGYYRPRALHAVKVGVDTAGNPSAWHHRVVCQSFMEGTPFEPVLFRNGVDPTSVEGAAELPYACPNVRVEWCRVAGGVPTQFWRSVGHSHTAFVVETLIDEMATAAKKDPYEYRKALLAKHPRHLKVLNLAAEKGGWGRELPKGRARGIAVHESFESFVAQVVEVSVSKTGVVRVHKVTCAVDCGPVVNPDAVKSQMEGCVAFGLTAALYGEITFEKGRVKQSNFHDYPMLRIHEMPEVEVHIVPSADKMGGVGEPGVPPIAPAVANAIYVLTGKRLRSLPIRPADLV